LIETSEFLTHDGDDFDYVIQGVEAFKLNETASQILLTAAFARLESLDAGEPAVEMGTRVSLEERSSPGNSILRLEGNSN
jgi:hypothetical protein